MSKTQQDSNAPKTESVTLKKPHEHNEKLYGAGDKIDVTPHEKELLIGWGVIEEKPDNK